MKEFNYEEAKAGAKVCTRDGDSVTITNWNNGIKSNPISVIIDGREKIGGIVYPQNGKFYGEFDAPPRGMDLMMEE